MNTKQKIEYIQSVYNKFTDARNHGNGNNWWYPIENRISYDVKIRGTTKDIDDIRDAMSERQKDYYTDAAIYDICDEMQSDACSTLVSDIKDIYSISDVYFAGRSGGWCEVQYKNNIDISCINDETTSDYVEYIDDEYKKACNLDNLEGDISSYIKDSHKKYCEYLNTDAYIIDIIENMLSDDGIADIYKSKIKTLVQKLV